MAYEDDLLNVAQNRRRTGRSFFPAANYPQGQTIIPSRYGTSSAVLPPDQNPAYQAAIAKGRPNMNNYSWITTASGGQMRVPTASIDTLVRPNTALSGSFVNPPTGPLNSNQYNSSYAKGYGAPAPSFNQGTGTLASGGVATPVEQLTPAQRSVLPGSNPIVNQWAANFAANNPRLAAFGTLAANAWTGLRGTLNTPSADQYVNNLSTGQPSQQSVQSQNYYGYNPSPAPVRRYSDLGYY